MYNCFASPDLRCYGIEYTVTIAHTLTSFLWSPLGRVAVEAFARSAWDGPQRAEPFSLYHSFSTVKEAQETVKLDFCKDTHATTGHTYSIQPYSTKISWGLKLTIFMIRSNLWNVHFAKCSLLNETRLMLNGIANFNCKIFHYKQNC